MTTLYRDCLGNLSAEANVTVFGANYGQPGTGYLSMSGISDCPRIGQHWPYESIDVSYIVAELEEDGWHCVVDKDGYNAPVIRCTHIETQAAIDRMTSDSDVEFTNSERGYIRFGACPTNGRSVNHRDDCFEAGVSCFLAEFSGNNYRVLVNDVLTAT